MQPLSDEEILNCYTRSIELRVENKGNGKSPFDENQLKEEIFRRMEKPATIYRIEGDSESTNWQKHQ